jgi:copper transport protein
VSGWLAADRTNQWPRRVFVTLLFAAAAMVAGAGRASAHAVLVAADPAPNSVLPTLPGQLRLTFAESVELPAHALRVFDPDGLEVDDGTPNHPGGSGATVGIGIRPSSKQGSYAVAWRVVSSDTHPVSGAFTFSVGHPSPTAAAVAPSSGSAVVGMLYGITRTLAYGSYAALVGGGAFLLVCWPSGCRRSVGPGVVVAGWAALGVTTVATLLLQGPYGDGTALGHVFDAGAVATSLRLPLGSALVARLLLLVGTAVYLGQLMARLPSASTRIRRAFTAVGLVLAVGLAGTWSISGHAAVGPQPAVAVAVDLAHLLAMAVWLGGLAVLALALHRLPANPDERREVTRAAGRFSRIAAGCVIVLVGTGAYQTWRQLGSPTAFLATDYGRVLLIKLGAVGALLAVAGASRHAVRLALSEPELATPGRHAPLRRLRRTALIETGIAALVLALTAILVNAEPGRTAQAAASEAAAAADAVSTRLLYDAGGPSGTGILAIHLAPARTGPTSLDITVHGPTGAPLDLAELVIELSQPERHFGPLRISLRREGPGQYHGSGQIPFAGTWQLAASVRTSDIDQVTVRMSVNIR